jgi:hypothetical protein
MDFGNFPASTRRGMRLLGNIIPDVIARVLDSRESSSCSEALEIENAIKLDFEALWVFEAGERKKEGA